jgi:hypothetical protein
MKEELGSAAGALVPDPADLKVKIIVSSHAPPQLPE